MVAGALSGTNPSALASKVFSRPSLASIPHFEYAITSSGSTFRFAADTIATFDSRERRLWQARCAATKDEEQAVSTTRFGPCVSSRNAMRPESHALCRSHPSVGTVTHNSVQLHPRVIVIAKRNKDSNGSSRQRLRRNARIDQSVPSRLEHHPLLRINAFGLARRDTKEFGIELIYFLEISSPAELGVRSAFPAIEREASPESFPGLPKASSRTVLESRLRSEGGMPCRRPHWFRVKESKIVRLRAHSFHRERDFCWPTER